VNPAIAVSIVRVLVGVFRRRKTIRTLVLPAVEAAASRSDLTSSDARREWVVRLLAAKGLPELEARLLVEAAVKIWKRRRERRSSTAR